MLWDMSLHNWMISLAFFSCFAFVTGWLTDRILLSAGFGTIGNWLLVLLGSYAGLLAVNLYGYNLEWYPMITISSVVICASGIFLTMCAIKRIFYL